MTPPTTVQRGPDVAIAVSWASEEEELKNDFLHRLRVRLNSHVDYTFDVWDSSMTPAGLLWQKEVIRQLDSRPYAMPLISPAYLDSEFIRTEEWPRAACAVMFPVGLVPVTLKKDVLNPNVTAPQLILSGGKFFSDMEGKRQKDAFTNHCIEAIINRLEYEARIGTLPAHPPMTP